ncbi:MAG: hypothetical protein WA667_10130 [Candidatus Nitrosopolaris sp.]
MIAGKEMRDSDILWLPDVGISIAPTLVSFDKAFLGRPVNSSQIWQVANKTGWDDGGQNTTALHVL